MGVTFSNKYSKWIVSIGIVMVLYSISYFYFTLPTSDSQYFRGLTEFYIETNNLDPLQPNHIYYQWPGFFILSGIVTSVSGLPLLTFEILLYTLIGFLLATSLYVYGSRLFKRGGFIVIPVFFISMFYFLNYQSAPFSLALSLFFLLLILETQKTNTGWTIVTIILFVSLSVIHAFLPIFFIIYVLMRYIFDRTRYFGNLLIFTSIFFVIIQFTLAEYSFVDNIYRVMRSSSDYSNIAEATFASASVPLDIMFQLFSRAVTITFIVISGVGFMFLFIKGKINSLDKALFLTGLIYLGFGIFLDSLGERAIIISFIPISLGASFLFEKTYRTKLKYLLSIILIAFLILFPFIPLHQSFTHSVHFQTQETYKADDFFIEYYNWERHGYILADFRAITYVSSKLDVNHGLTADLDKGKQAHTIFYTTGLGKSLASRNITMDEIINGERFNTIYNNGFSYLAILANS